MAFADSTYATKITISSALVASTQTDFVHIVTQDVLPSALLDSTSGTSCLNGGGDLLAYAEDPTGGSEPATRYAIDIRDCTVTAGPGGTAQIAIRVPSVSSLADTDYWLVWGDAAGTQPAAGAAYGRNAVYSSDYAAVWALESDPSGSAPQLTDRTGNGGDGTTAGSMTSGDLITGKLGDAWALDGSDDYVSCSSASINTGQGNPLTVLCWARSSVSGVEEVLKEGTASDGRDGWDLIKSGTSVGFVVRNATTTAYGDAGISGFVDGGWHQIGGVFRGGSYEAETLMDGALSGAPATADATYPLTKGTVSVGRRLSSGSPLYYEGDVDETWILSAALSANDILTIYRSQNDPGTFASNNGVNAIASAAAPPFPFYYWYQ